MNCTSIERLNFRDCGGMRTTGGDMIRRGVLYRSGSLDRISRSERTIISDCRITTVIDLRPLREQSAHRRDRIGMRRVTIPFDIDLIVKKRIAPFILRRGGAGLIRNAVTDVYREIPLLCNAQLGDLFSVLEQGDSYPVCIFCRAGKDRTGYTVALLLRMAGVAFDDILEDYLLSNNSILPRMRAVTRPLHRASFGLIPALTWESAATVCRDYLEAAFDTIGQQFGSVKNYLGSCGISAERQNAVRAHLCAPLQTV